MPRRGAPIIRATNQPITSIAAAPKSFGTYPVRIFLLSSNIGSISAPVLFARCANVISTLLLDDPVSLFIQNVENLNQLIGRFIASIGEISLDDGILPFRMATGF
jgi:hypothetical protein